MKKTLAVIIMSCLVLAAGAAPPGNVIPRKSNVEKEVEELRAEFKRLRDADAERQKEVAALRADLKRARDEAAGLRARVEGLETELARRPESPSELEGSWQVVEAAEDGLARPGAASGLVVRGHTLTFRYRDGRRDRTCWFWTDPGADPRGLVVHDGPRPTLGIYAVAGDRLTLCVDRTGAGRPAKFASEPGGQTTLWVLKREPRPNTGGEAH